MIGFWKTIILKISHSWKDLITLLLLSLIFLVVVILDFTYYGKINFCIWVRVIEKLRKYGKCIGFSYNGAEGILSGSFGILVTGISIILTTSIQLANRSENKIYGISRKELNFSKMGLLYKQMRRIAFLTPVMMIIAINLHLCLTGYSILFYIYIFLGLNYILYLTSYRREKDIEMVIKILVLRYKDTEKSRYKMALDDVCREVEKEGCREEVAQMFQSLIEESYLESEKDSFWMCNRFFYTVFLGCLSENMRIIKSREQNAIEIVEDYITKNIDECEKELGIKSRQYLVLWSMICCVFEYCSVDSIEQYLQWFMDFEARSNFLVRRKNRTISSCAQYLQIGLILILLEIWLYKHEISDRQFTWKLNEIWEYGKRMLSEENKDIIREYINYYSVMVRENEEKIFEKIELLYEDAEKNIGKTIIWNLVNH